MSTRGDDAALLRAMRDAKFGPNVRVTLPTGETLAGDEMAFLVDVENATRPSIGRDMNQIAIDTLVAKGTYRSLALAKEIDRGRSMHADHAASTSAAVEPPPTRRSLWNLFGRLNRKRLYSPKDGDKVWYRDSGGPYGDDHWHWGHVSRPVQPDRSAYYVRIEGDPMRSRTVAAEDLIPYYQRGYSA
jgi:hypothetical protein